jgi:hypothetical protein
LPKKSDKPEVGHDVRGVAQRPPYIDFWRILFGALSKVREILLPVKCREMEAY